MVLCFLPGCLSVAFCTESGSKCTTEVQKDIMCSYPTKIKLPSGLNDYNDHLTIFCRAQYFWRIYGYVIWADMATTTIAHARKSWSQIYDQLPLFEIHSISQNVCFSVCYEWKCIILTLLFFSCSLRLQKTKKKLQWDELEETHQLKQASCLFQNSSSGTWVAQNDLTCPNSW